MSVLVISCHTDDAELAAGGTISSFPNVYGYCPTLYHDYGNGFKTWEECIKAWGVLGIKKVGGGSHHARQINRQELLDQLISINKTLKPTLVITHGSKDVHQSHQVVYQESVRAFKNTTIIGFNHPWNCVNGSNDNYFVALNECNVEMKMDALSCYESQKKRGYLNKDYQLSLLKTTGTLINTKYAESFETIRIIK